MAPFFILRYNKLEIKTGGIFMLKFNAFELKIIALVLMLMDHLYIAFPNAFSSWYHPLSRVVAPYIWIFISRGTISH